MHELLEIGRFAAVSGLSVPALRHYDEVGILKPASSIRRPPTAAAHPTSSAMLG